ncbi:MAG: hypothetical protein ACR2NG_01540 [Acidimicrobiia bacterium]
MQPNIPDRLRERARGWESLSRIERRHTAIALRELGLSFGEIRAVIPVTKSTLSNWLRSIELDTDQIASIKARTGPQARVGRSVDTQWRRRQKIAQIRTEARQFALAHLHEPLFAAGVALYWGEGSKTRSHVDLTNSDPAALRVFIAWVRTYLSPETQFVLCLHIHAGNDESAAREYWMDELNLPNAEFGKTFIKPSGTGHRKNHLPHGICRVRTRRAADNWHRIMVWIDVAATELTEVPRVPC